MMNGSDADLTTAEGLTEACDRCGRPRRVGILAGYVDGRPAYRSFCLACAEAADEERFRETPAQFRPQPTLASLLIAAGLLLTLFGAAIDQFGVQTSVGFGAKQQAGLLIGVLIITLGALLRVDVLLTAGSILFVVAALADFVGELGTPGLGWQQGSAILVGLASFLIGLLLWGRKSPRRPPERGG